MKFNKSAGAKSSEKKSSKSIVLEFEHERETPGTNRFMEVDADGNPLEMKEAVVGAIYIRKPAGKDWKKIRVTIENIG